METKIFTASEIEDAKRALADGQLVAFPTETVYGLGADATNEAAVKQVYQAKGRPSDNPLIVHVSGPEMVWQYAEVDAKLKAKMQKLIDAFWAGPLTVILPVKQGKLSTTVTGGLSTVAFRMPDNDLTLDLINRLQRPIVGPSANTSGKPSPTLATHVYHDLQGKIAGILDDGATRVGLESTVLDLTSSVPTILRPGFLTQDQLQEVLGSVQSSNHPVQAGEVPKAPGMKYKHYAPNAQVIVVDAPEDFPAAVKAIQAKQQPFSVMAEEKVLETLQLPAEVATFSLGNSIATASHLLFAGLRYFDSQPQMKYILAQGTSDSQLGAAYMNRLDKAAGNQHFHSMEEQ